MTQPGKSNSETILLYVPFFKTGLSYALLRFLTLIQNIIKGQILIKGLQMSATTKNIISRVVLRFIEQKYQAIGINTIVN